jgi:hypothetical protein
MRPIMATDGPTDNRPLRALGLVCSLKPTGAESSSELIAQHVFEHMRDGSVECETVRCVDYAISPGVEADMGGGTRVDLD